MPFNIFLAIKQFLANFAPVIFNIMHSFLVIMKFLGWTKLFVAKFAWIFFIFVNFHMSRESTSKSDLKQTLHMLVFEVKVAWHPSWSSLSFFVSKVFLHILQVNLSRFSSLLLWRKSSQLVKKEAPHSHEKVFRGRIWLVDKCRSKLALLKNTSGHFGQV